MPAAATSAARYPIASAKTKRRRRPRRTLGVRYEMVPGSAEEVSASAAGAAVWWSAEGRERFCRPGGSSPDGDQRTRGCAAAGALCRDRLCERSFFHTKLATASGII